MTCYLPKIYPLDIKYPQAVKQLIIYYCKDNSKKLYPINL